MSIKFSFITDTATLAIFDLQAIKHRKTDTADWWSVPDDELNEMNKGNIAFINLKEDGCYTVALLDDVDHPDLITHIFCPSGEIFIGAGEDTTGGDLEPDAPEYYSGKILFLPTGDYEISMKKDESDLFISMVLKK